jgi:hypothetical protein
MHRTRFRMQVTTAVVSAIALVSIAVIAVPSASVSAAAPAAVAPQLSSHLEVQSAIVTEMEPIDILTVDGRPVRFELVLADAPSCTVSTTDLRFGFFIDSDKNSATGLTDAALNDLGVDAKVEVKCDSTTQTYISSVGTATVTTNMSTNETTVRIDTTVDQLPSVDFHWIAYAFDNAEMGRLPDAGDHGHWAIFEILLP